MSFDTRAVAPLSIIARPPVHGTAETTLAVAGEIDRDNCRLVGEAVTEILADPAVQRVCLDMGEVTFFDSARTRALLCARRDAARSGRELLIGRAHLHVYQVLEVTGLLDEFHLTRPRADMVPTRAG